MSIWEKGEHGGTYAGILAMKLGGGAAVEPHTDECDEVASIDSSNARSHIAKSSRVMLESRDDMTIRKLRRHFSVSLE
jgi:hypothetical protein